MERIKFNRNIILRHILNWTLAIVLRHIIIELEKDLAFQIIRSTIRFSIYISAYYVFCIYISPLLSIKNYKKSGLAIVLYFIIYVLLIYYAEYGPGLIESGEYFFWDGFDTFISYSLVFVYISMLSHGFYKKQKSIQRLNVQSKYEQILLKQEALFFRNQFNSHISLNFLTHCYAVALKNNNSISNAIETYSEMMKYTLFTKPIEVVPLIKEVNYIEQFIKLQKLIGKEVYVNFFKTGIFSKTQILPRILINYIENAFKYGISNQIDKPIVLSLFVEQGLLIFNIRNFKTNKIATINSTRIGQYNSRQQLELFYPDRFQIDIIEDEFLYTCNLKINLKLENDKLYYS
jgi:two-component system, LytTR family, sensor kinase